MNYTIQTMRCRGDETIQEANPSSKMK